jgi:ATP-binding cassette subfamily B protein
LVLEHGKLVELGTHNELIEKKGIYYNLVLAQLRMTRLVGDEEIVEEEIIQEIV